ncbi:MAG: 6-O-methylguanine DNA methyltransferase [Alphaproteobacteria bacterium]|nr:6-O-methylguanine DNA methyltransferase [Alphaproteobacteria bacterium]
MRKMAIIEMVEQDNRDEDYGFALVGRVLSWLSQNWRDQPSLERIAAEAGLSPYHLHRLFTRYVGVTPKKYVQYLTLDHAKQALDNSQSVLDVAFETGLSGAGRLHDLFVTHETMTPGDWKRRGDGLELHYGWHDSPFGECLIVASARGVCGLAFNGTDDRARTLADLCTSLDGATVVENPDTIRPYAEAAFGGGDVHLVLRGTPFQLKVWEALMRIPEGSVVTYSDLAERIGAPGSARAVAGAVARNPVSWLIPCHRVIRNGGTISGYRWHPDKKRLILAWEAAQSEPSRNTERAS